MNEKLEEELFKKYPKIFRQEKLSMRETCMCWGLEHGDGWKMLVDELCCNLQNDTDYNGYPQVEASQVKQKFGGLRFYYDPLCSVEEETGWRKHVARILMKIFKFMSTKNIARLENKIGNIEGMIRFAESLSYKICEDCGSTDDVKQSKGWVRTECAKCRKEREERRKSK